MAVDVTEQEEARILREYFESDAQRRSVEREFEQIAREFGGSIGLTRAQMEQLMREKGV